MDLLLTSFVSNIIETLSYTELNNLDQFLNCNDEDIMSFYSNKKPIPNFDNKKILDLFTSYKNK